MANRFQTPRPQFFTNPVTGLPLSGGKINFYANGTVTPLSTYTNSALTIANANPVVLLSTGYAATDIFLQNAAYTVVLTDSNNVVLWSADNVYTSDFSTVAMFTSYNGNPNGFVAGTAGSSSLAASVIWDYQNLVLYVCTATGNAASAVWLAVTSNTTAASVASLQGFLTPVSATPIITADSLAATTLYYTPFLGATLSIYNGTSLANGVFAEMQLNLAAASHLASTIYDVFVFNNAGVFTLVTGPAWTNSAAATGARGSGAGTTQISRGTGIGIWTNTNSMTGTNGVTTFAGIAAGQATYLGSIFIDTIAGQVTCHRSAGASRKFGIWNAYNRQRIQLNMVDVTASWVYNTNTWRQSRATATNVATSFCGLPEEIIFAEFKQNISGLHQNGTATATIGIGLNSTTVPANLAGVVGESQDNITGSTSNNIGNASTWLDPTIGINNFNSLENGMGGTGTNTFSGTTASMRFQLMYRG